MQVDVVVVGGGDAGRQAAAAGPIGRSDGGRPRRGRWAGGRRGLSRAGGRGANGGRDAPRRRRRRGRRDRDRRDPARRAGQSTGGHRDEASRRATRRRRRGPGQGRDRVGPDVVRFDGDEQGRVRAVVTGDGQSTRRATPRSSTSGVAPRDLLARMAPGVTSAGAVGDDYPLPPPAPAGVVCGCMGTTVADLESALGLGLHRHRAPQAGELGGPRPVPGWRLPAAPSVVRRRPHGNRPGAVHRPPRRPPDHARRGRRRRRDRRLPADAAARRAPRPGRADGPLRRLVAAVALRRRTRGVPRGSRAGLARRRVDARQARSSPGRTSSRRSSGSIPATSRISSPADRATRCSSTSAAT